MQNQLKNSQFPKVKQEDHFKLSRTEMFQGKFWLLGSTST